MEKKEKKKEKEKLMNKGIMQYFYLDQFLFFRELQNMTIYNEAIIRCFKE